MPGAFASLLAQERDTPSCLATAAIMACSNEGRFCVRSSVRHVEPTAVQRRSPHHTCGITELRNSALPSDLAVVGGGEPVAEWLPQRAVAAR